MDTQTRIEAAKARLEANRAVLVLAKKAGPPCSECRWYLTSGLCGHPAYGEQSFEPTTGATALITRTELKDARSSTGLCGFEGTLFEDPRRFLERLRGRSGDYANNLTWLGLGLLAGAYLGFLGAMSF